MIRFSMKCNNNHNFDSWFQSSEAFEKLASSGMLSCIHCGDTNISKSLMAPKVTTKKIKEKLSLTAPKGDIEKALAKLKLEVELVFYFSSFFLLSHLSIFIGFLLYRSPLIFHRFS